MRFASFLSGGFTTMTVKNPPEKKLEKRTSVQLYKLLGQIFLIQNNVRQEFQLTRPVLQIVRASFLRQNCFCDFKMITR